MMREREDKIAIFVQKEGIEYVFNSFPNEYRNLMELLKDKLYIADFGDCKGMGRCGTCTIAIVSKEISLPPRERNEGTTLEKFDIKDPDVRLACQLIINNSISGLRFEIIEGNGEGAY